MAKLLDKFTAPFRDSRIPFLLAEVVTNGAGQTKNATGAPQARVRAIIQPKGKNAGTEQPGEPLTLRPAVKFVPAKP